MCITSQKKKAERAAMPNEKSRIVRIASVQMESKNGLVEANLEHASPMVEQAAREGAKLVLLPEFMPTGYIFTTAIWDGAEPGNGQTVQWLKANSKRLGIWLGTSFLEADSEHFFNTFVLTTPEGVEAGRVRKETVAAFEAFFTKDGPGSHVINTELGKIGVGICYENQLAYIPQIMYRESVDLLLMPHSYPIIAEMMLTLGELAGWYARLLGIPAIVCNKCGRWQAAYPGLPFYKAESYFPGLSTIADSDGTIKVQVKNEEKVIVADVTLDRGRKTRQAPRPHGRWADDGKWLRNGARVIEAVGGMWYTLSRERKRKALRISSGEKKKTISK
jgi:N-carbamoylputrescine amidase